MPGIILTTDLSEESRRAFRPACDLARRLLVPVHLLGVVEDLPIEPSAEGLIAAYPDRAQVVADWQKELDRIAAELGAGVTAHVRDEMDVPKAIIEFAEQQDADYIAMATHGRTGLRRLLIGSVAEAVLRSSPNREAVG